MKLFHLSQDVNGGYDTYNAVIVAAETESEARVIHPSGYVWTSHEWMHTRSDGSTFTEGHHGTWANPDNVTVEYIGEAKEGTDAGMILASFNAG